MKYFLAKADIRDGETDYADSFIVKASCLDKADKIAHKIKDKILGFNDYREIRLRGMQEIPLAEAKILEKLGLSYVSN
jgi:hypothetical protein